MNKEKSIELSNNLYTWYRMDLLITETDLLVVERKNVFLTKLSRINPNAIFILQQPAVIWNGDNWDMITVHTSIDEYTFDVLNDNIDNTNHDIRKYTLEEAIEKIDIKYRESIILKLYDQIIRYIQNGHIGVYSEDFIKRMNRLVYTLSKN